MDKFFNFITMCKDLRSKPALATNFCWYFEFLYLKERRFSLDCMNFRRLDKISDVNGSCS